MSVLSKIFVLINRKSLKSFQSISINENLYGIDSLEIICRYDALEELDGFLIEKTKDYLGLPVVIQTKIKVKGVEKDGITFQGYITEIQGSRGGMSDYDQIIISGGSKEIILNRKPTNRAFLDKTLDEIVKEVLKDYDLRSKIKSKNKLRFPYIVQYEESDLEFLKRLSIRYGEWFFFDGEEIIFGEMPVVERSLTIGYNLNDFNYELRVSPVNFSLFSIDNLKIKDVHKYKSGSSKVEANLNIYGKHALNMSKKVYSLEGKDYYEHLNVDESEYKKGLDHVGEIQETADAVNLTDISGSSINGFLSAGNQVKINCLKQDGKGRMDYGKYLITSVQHTLDNTLAYQNSFSAIPAETAIPENTDPYFVKTTSNQLGMIADNKDPKKLGRVRITFWWMGSDKIMTPWVKVLTPYTLSNRGIYFVPSLYTRVLVGFEDGDVEKPYCLGNLFDENTCPDPEWTGNANDHDAKIHAIRTASGQTIEFHDSDGAEKIKIYDAKSNKYEVIFDTGKEEIQLKSTGKISLEAKEIEITAENGLKLKAGNIDESATNIKINGDSKIGIEATDIGISANASLKAEGSANAEVSSSGVTAVKGSMVQIN